MHSFTIAIPPLCILIAGIFPTDGRGMSSQDVSRRTNSRANASGPETLGAHVGEPATSPAILECMRGLHFFDRIKGSCTTQRTLPPEQCQLDVILRKVDTETRKQVTMALNDAAGLKGFVLDQCLVCGAENARGCSTGVIGTKLFFVPRATSIIPTVRSLVVQPQ